MKHLWAFVTQLLKSEHQYTSINLKKCHLLPIRHPYVRLWSSTLQNQEAIPSRRRLHCALPQVSTQYQTITSPILTPQSNSRWTHHIHCSQSSRWIFIQVRCNHHTSRCPMCIHAIHPSYSSISISGTPQVSNNKLFQSVYSVAFGGYSRWETLLGWLYHVRNDVFKVFLER